MSSSTTSICLYHDRKYSSDLQCIFNLLRKNQLKKTKCDLNLIGKKSLCTCQSSSNSLPITDEQFFEKQKEFDKLKIHSYLQTIEQIIQFKIMNTCQDQTCLYKLFKFICDICNETIFAKMIQIQQNDRQVELIRSNAQSRHSNSIHRTIELTLPSNQLSYLLGHGGHAHKKIMQETKTRIHFNNAPYAIKSKTKQTSEFNLDLFQSSSPLQANITGNTIEAVEEAVKALEQLDQKTRKKIGLKLQQ